MAKRRKGVGGRPCAYPGKHGRSLTILLTPAAKNKLKDVKRRQKTLNFKDVEIDPSTSDIMEGLLHQFGDKLCLPRPSRV